MQIHALYGGGEGLLRDIPDPFGSITHRDLLFRPAPAPLPGLQGEALAELFGGFDGAGVGGRVRIHTYWTSGAVSTSRSRHLVLTGSGYGHEKGTTLFSEPRAALGAWGFETRAHKVRAAFHFGHLQVMSAKQPV